jgi:hypothetical protein
MRSRAVFLQRHSVRTDHGGIRQRLHPAGKKSERRWLYIEASHLPASHIKIEGIVSKKEISADC